MPESEREFWRAYFGEAISLHWSRESISRQGQCVADFAQNYEFAPTDLANWPGNILIIESKDDKAIPSPAGNRLKELYPQAQVHVFHNAGHVPLITKREDYIAIIKTFLKTA